MPSRLGPLLIKLLVISFFVGLILSFFSVNPRELLSLLGDTGKQIFQIIADFFEWALQYILLGAVVVVPIWGLLALWRAARNKQQQ